MLLRRHWQISVILVLFLSLGTAYSLANPLFESPDEVWHYEYTRWLVEGHGLPTPEEVGKAPWHQEGSQPPLYYMLSAALTAFVPTANHDLVVRYNPHAAIGGPDNFGNKNVIVPGPGEAWPWQGVTLAAHLIRFFSLFLGAVTVLSTYGTALVIFPGGTWLAAMAAAIVAFNPQFLFISASINNDNLVIAVSAAGIWLLLRLLAQRDSITPGPATSPEETAALPSTGVQAAPRLWQLVLLGLVIGADALAKISGLALAGLAGLALLTIAWRRQSLRGLLTWGVTAGAVALAAGGWWFWRNWQLYGDPLGLKAMFDVLPRRSAAPAIAELIARSEGIWRSAWAVFGWFNVVADTWVYTLYTALCLIALVGLIVALPARYLLRRLGTRHETDRPAARSSVRRSTAVQLGLLVVWIVVILFSLLVWAGMRYPQGRLLFPAISAAAVLLSLGLAAWLPHRWWAIQTTFLASGLFVLAAFVLWRWIIPAYAPPPLLAANAAVPNASAYDFGNQIRLAGYEMKETQVHPGDALHLTLYWQALETPPVDYTVFIHLTDENGILQAQSDSYPGAGSLPTSGWRIGSTIPDSQVVMIPETALAPSQLKVEIGLYNYATGKRLPVAGGDVVPLGNISLAPLEGENGTPNPLLINFDNQIVLVGFQFDRRVMAPGDKLGLTLWWKALSTPREDYVAFVHLMLPQSPQDTVWAQVDHAPQANGDRSSRWKPGQEIEDSYHLTLPNDAPPGIYSVEIGLYDPKTFDRLPVGLSDAGIVLGKIAVK